MLKKKNSQTTLLTIKHISHFAV